MPSYVICYSVVMWNVGPPDSDSIMVHLQPVK